MRVAPPKAASVVMGMQQPLLSQTLPAQQGWPGPPQATPVPEVPPVPLPPPPLPPLLILASLPAEPPALEPPSPLAPPLPVGVLLLLLHPISHKAAMVASEPAPRVRLTAIVSKVRVVMRFPFLDCRHVGGEDLHLPSKNRGPVMGRYPFHPCRASASLAGPTIAPPCTGERRMTWEVSRR
jgi:hypothetical protein